MYTCGVLKSQLAPPLLMGGLVAYNFIGMSISHAVGVMSRTVLETLRTLLCWGQGCHLSTPTS